MDQDLPTIFADNILVYSDTYEIGLPKYSVSQIEDIFNIYISPSFSGTVSLPDGSTITATSSSYLTESNVIALLSPYATLDTPTFTGIVTLPDGSVISGTSSSYLKQLDAASVYLSKTDATNTYLTQSNAASSYTPKANPTFTGTVTFPDGSSISPTTNDFLNTSYASYVSSTFAPLENPTFTGTINLNGNVSLAQTSANTLTLYDHLVLCTGSNFTTPVSGQQGYMLTGTIPTDLTSIPSASVTALASITLSYGVWLIIGQGGIYNSSGAAASCVMSNKQFGLSNSATAFESKYQSRSIGSYTLGIGVAACEQVNRVVTVTNSSTPYYLHAYVNYSAGILQTWSAQSHIYAVRIA